MSDRIWIRDLEVTCIIGIHPRERVTPQVVRLTIALECDLEPAARSDAIGDTVDYQVLKNQIVDQLAATRYGLIERMAAHVLRLCLADPRVAAATVTVDKPGALTGARSVAVELRRTRAEGAPAPC